MSKTVTKKILPEYFKAVKDCQKTFELRKDEDHFEVGDTILLAEWDGEKFTGHVCDRTITYILRNCPEYGLMPGYCILGIQCATEVFVRETWKKEHPVVMDKLDACQNMEKPHWIASCATKKGYYFCSNCGEPSRGTSSYCPFCNAKMEGEIYLHYEL